MVCACARSSRAACGEACTRCCAVVPYDLSSLGYSERQAFLETVPAGTALTLHGHNFAWTSSHARPSEVTKWRMEADPLADAAFASLERGTLSAGRGISALSAHVIANGDADTACAALLSAAELPTWADEGMCDRGGAVWFSNAPVLGPCLLGLSLLGGFGSSAINETLVSAGGLAGSRDSVHRRLTETLQFVNDVSSPGALRRGRRGWAAAMDIRLLHARVRARLAATEDHRGAAATGANHCPFGFANGTQWDPSARGTLGVPVSAGDMLATQLAFSLVMLMGAERVGLAWHLSDADVRAVLHLWSVVGHLLGVRPTRWGASGDICGAKTTLESLVVVLGDPGPSTTQLVLATARAAAWRLPFCWSPRDQIAVSSALAGARYAKALGLPSLDSPALTRPLEDPAPTTAFLAELAFVHTMAPHLAVDADAGGDKARASLLVAPVLRLASRAFFFSASLLSHIASFCSSALFLGFSSESKSVMRGYALIAPLRIWPIIVWALPARARDRLAELNEAALVRIVERRLRGRAHHAL